MSNINSPLSQSAEIKILTERQHTKTMFHNFSGIHPSYKKRLYVLILASIRVPMVASMSIEQGK